MTVLIIAALALVGLSGTAVVASNAPQRQAVTLSFFGLTLTVLFLAFQAPDVALSQIGVNTAIVPLMVMLAVRTMTARRASEHKRPPTSQDRQQAADEARTDDGDRT